MLYVLENVETCNSLLVIIFLGNKTERTIGRLGI